MSLHCLYFSAVVLLELFGTEKETLHYNESTLSDGIQKIFTDPRLPAVDGAVGMGKAHRCVLVQQADRYFGRDSFLHERSQLFKVMNCYQYCFFIDFFS